MKPSTKDIVKLLRDSAAHHRAIAESYFNEIAVRADAASRAAEYSDAADALEEADASPKQDAVALAYKFAELVARWNREDAELDSARAELTEADRSHEDGENDGIRAQREVQAAAVLGEADASPSFEEKVEKACTTLYPMAWPHMTKHEQENQREHVRSVLRALSES